jgi:signal transduction histidine kinase
MVEMRSESRSFKPRARLLSLLGEQLIRDPSIAVFELVKNAYDADASRVVVTMNNPDDKSNGSIIVRDDGCGMTWDVLTKQWMEPGTDYRQTVEGRKTTPKFQRIPLGEKGIGRFAAHKLGSRVEIVTKSMGQSEIFAVVDWTKIEKIRYLDEALIQITEREAEYFKKSTGTRIKITNLKETWTRGMVRQLYRNIISISSPFTEQEPFETKLIVKPYEDWTEGISNISDILSEAPFLFYATIGQGQIKYKYDFKSPMPTLESRSIHKVESLGKGPKGKQSDETQAADVDKYRIGTVSINLRVWDLDKELFYYYPFDRGTLRKVLGESGGIRVYRDGMRVYDYGEPGNDWLELGVWRTNRPQARISNNQVIGAVELNRSDSEDLREKTNREGFIENNAYVAFRKAVKEAISHFSAEFYSDKIRLKQVLKKAGFKEPVLGAISELRSTVAERGLTEELGPIIDQVEKQFVEVRDRILVTASSGLSLLVLVHEVEKGISELKRAVERQSPMGKIAALADHLSELVQGMTYLARRSTHKKEKISAIIKQALFNVDLRLQYHGIKVINGMETGDEDFSIKCHRRLIVATIMNLIDNSIYWLDVKGGTKKILYVGTTADLLGGQAIVVGDNGPGFSDPPEFMIEPFFSRKPDGMGLGLYVANEVMKAHEGQLVFPQKGDIKLPAQITGAVVALRFKGD